jgi:hypothetical protein
VQSGDVQVMTFSSVGVDPRGFDPRGFDPRDEAPSVFARGDVIDTVGEVVEEPQRERLLPPLSCFRRARAQLSRLTPAPHPGASRAVGAPCRWLAIPRIWSPDSAAELTSSPVHTERRRA